jgi:hypothetical protein
MRYLLILAALSNLHGLFGEVVIPDREPIREDQPCYKESYPDFLQLPPAAAVENAVVADPTGIGERWNRLVQTAPHPNPKDFSWFREYGTWTCRYKQKDIVVWHTFPPETNKPNIVGTTAYGSLLIASIADLMKQGMQPEDVTPFRKEDLVYLENSPHTLAPQLTGDAESEA